MGKAHLFDDVGPFTIVMPFSVRQGKLQSESTQELYSLSTVVPNARRRLARRRSDLQGATNVLSVTASEAKKQEAEKKSKAAHDKKKVCRTLGRGISRLRVFPSFSKGPLWNLEPVPKSSLRVNPQPPVNLEPVSKAKAAAPQSNLELAATVEDAGNDEKQEEEHHSAPEDEPPQKE